MFERPKIYDAYHAQAENIFNQSVAFIKFRFSEYLIPNPEKAKQAITVLTQIPENRRTNKDELLLLKLQESAGYISVKPKHLYPSAFELALEHRMEAVRIQRKRFQKNQTAEEAKKLANYLYCLAIAYAEKPEKDIARATANIKEAIEILNAATPTSCEDLEQLGCYYEDAALICRQTNALLDAYSYYKASINCLYQIKAISSDASAARNEMIQSRIEELNFQIKMMFKDNLDVVVEIADQSLALKSENEFLRKQFSEAKRESTHSKTTTAVAALHTFHTNAPKNTVKRVDPENRVLIKNGWY